VKRPLEGAALLRAQVEITRLENLAIDLRRIINGTGPTAAELKNAPVLTGWVQATRQEVCLTGNVGEHPLLGSCRDIRTSPLWSVHPTEGWARTYSRWYRLGARREDAEGWQ